MRIGFTGTRYGMSTRQKLELRKKLAGATEFHHGDCVGADAEADEIARDLDVGVVIHPPEDPKQRAFCRQPGDLILRPKPYLDRNKDIVNSVDLLIAAPRTMEEEVRSGTWSTIRYARRINKQLVILRR